MNQNEFETYLNNGVLRIVNGILKASLKNPGASKMMLHYIKASGHAKEVRLIHKANGEHIPPFLIGSITTSCNLHCKGCYARANHSCFDGKADDMLTANEWDNIFSQADELGVAFILLAGGEPFVRREILLTAGTHKNILFPIFTNGTMIDNDSITLLERNRNLLPIISIEGSEHTTNSRRGANIYSKIQFAMKLCKDRGILFGASITVQKNNLDEVTSDEFIKILTLSGCKAIIYVEYVPTDRTSVDIAPDDITRAKLLARIEELRKKNEDMLYIAFPGDEQSSGGCLAAGRGFFHINAYGDVEPCPFSPYSDTSLKNTSLKDALKSPLFTKLMDSGALLNENTGGCVLFNQEKLVKELAKRR